MKTILYKARKCYRIKNIVSENYFLFDDEKKALQAIRELDDKCFVVIMGYYQLETFKLYRALSKAKIPYAAYQTAAMNDIFKGTSSLLSGYHQAYPLLPKELDLLPGLIMNRVAMSAIICEWRAIDHPDNQEYILGGIQRMWKTLEALLKSDLEGVATTLKNNLTPVVD